MSGRVAYFKNVSQAVIDADQASAIASLSNSLTTLNTAVAAKADSLAVMNALAFKASVEEVALKANSSEVISLLGAKADAQAVNSALAMKASSQDLTDSVNVLNTSIGIVTIGLNGKANASELTSINTSIGNINSALSEKLNASVHTARVLAENEFLGAFREAVSLSNANNSGEFDYSSLGLSAPVAPQVIPQ